MRPSLPETVLVPVGQPLGWHFRRGDTLPVYRVRLGDTIFQLTLDRATVWEAAHQVVPGATRGRTLAELPAVVDTGGSFRVEDTVAYLIDVELLIEVPPLGPGIAEIGHDFRLLALMNGLGNLPERKDWFAYGVGADGYVLTSVLLGEIAGRGASAPDLYTLCERIAPYLADGEAAELAVPERLLTYVMQSVHPLLEAHAVYFDIAVDDRID